MKMAAGATISLNRAAVPWRFALEALNPRIMADSDLSLTCCRKPAAARLSKNSPITRPPRRSCSGPNLLFVRVEERPRFDNGSPSRVAVAAEAGSPPPAGCGDAAEPSRSPRQTRRSGTGSRRERWSPQPGHLTDEARSEIQEAQQSPAGSWRRNRAPEGRSQDPRRDANGRLRRFRPTPTGERRRGEQRR
jgi:hypothetical protein